MLNRTGVIFCSVSLVVTVVVCVAGFSLAALPRATVEASKKPTAPEALPELELHRAAHHDGIREVVDVL